MRTTRRRIRILGTVGVLVIGVTIVALVHFFSLGKADEAASVIGTFLTAALIFVGLLNQRWSGHALATSRSLGSLADDLATTLEQQWWLETAARGLDNPHILPLSWRGTERDIGDSPMSVLGLRVASSGSDVNRGTQFRLALDGRLEGRFEEVIHNVATAYRSITSGRLVILGQPGSGKSVLATLLTLGLLRSRTDSDPVPVLLNASSWDPIRQRLDDWMVASIAREHYDGRREIPMSLWAGRRLLPVLDGLDEIPEASRRRAVRQINDVIETHRPVIVTCRINEYIDVIAGGSPVLRRAPVVEIQPVAVADLIAYCRDISWASDVNWEPVYEYLKELRDTPLSRALSTPLMISFTRQVYDRLGGRPAELVDEARFGSQHAVEDYVLGKVVSAAYAPGDPASMDPFTPRSSWHADQAELWLKNLARSLHRHGQRDIAWWTLSDQLLSRWAVPVVGLNLGLIVLIATVLPSVVSGRAGGEPLSYYLGGSVWIGILVWILTMFVWYAIPTRPPGRLSLSVDGGFRRFKAGFMDGLRLATLPFVVTMVATTVALGADGGWPYPDTHELLQVTAVAVALVLLAGVALAVRAWLEAPPERSRRSSPLESLRDDRASTLVGALAAGILVSLLWYPAIQVLLIGADAIQSFPGTPGSANSAWSASWQQAKSTSWPELLGYVALPGVITTILLSQVRAWTHLFVARIDRAVRGQLPRQLMRFLDDAHNRGLLRETGGVYQFTHIRLQEQLADTTGTDATAPPIERIPHRRRAWAVVAIGSLAVAVAAIITIPRDSSIVTLEVPNSSGQPLHDWAYIGMNTAVANPSILLANAGSFDVWQAYQSTRTSPRRVAQIRRVCPHAVDSDPNISDFAVGGNTIVVACMGPSGLVALREAKTGAIGPPMSLSSNEPLTTIAVDQSGKWIAGITEQGGVRLWDSTVAPALPTELGSLTSPLSNGFLAIDAHHLVIQPYGTEDDSVGTQTISEYAYVWDLSRPRAGPATVYIGRDRPLASWIGADGKLRTCSPSAVHSIDLGQASPPAVPLRLLHPTALSHFVAAGHYDFCASTTSDDDAIVATDDTGSSVIVHRVGGAATRRLRGHLARAWPVGVAKSADGQSILLFTASDDETIKSWDVTDIAAG